jgi:AcrR family transcriptional regulator
VGRPPKVDRAMIAEAAHDVGLTGLTMKAVAEHLGVSIPALYHHVDGKDDLMRLAAEYTAGRIELPKARGQHWAVWLYEWALYNRDAFVAQPEMLKQLMEGGISMERQAETLDAVLGHLAGAGFTYPHAQLAYTTVSSYAVGSAVLTLRDQRDAEAGRAQAAELRRIVQESGGSRPHLQQWLDEVAKQPRQGFHDGLMIVLRGICEDRGERWSSVRAKLQRELRVAS